MTSSDRDSAEPADRPAPTPTDTPTREADVAGPPRRILKRVATFESFRYRDFSWYFTGSLLSNTGTWMQQVALGWLVYTLTKSSGALGLVAFLGGIPVTILNLFAGVLADRVDRRQLLIWSQVLLMAQALAFGVLTQTGHITMGWVYSLALGAGIVSAFMFPAWQAMVPDLVPRRSLLNAIALSSAQFNAARLLGPMIGAAVFAALGMAEVFYANALSFLFVIWALWVIRPDQVRVDHGDSGVISQLLEGLRYARAHKRVRSHLVTAAMMTMFAFPFITLLPVIAAETLGLGSSGYALLMGLNGGGALIGALGVASLPSSVRRDSIVRFGFAGLSLGVVVVGLSRSELLTGVVLVFVGAAFLACVSSINTSLQTAAPPEIRGRIMSLFVLAFMGLMPIGGIIFGALGDLIGAPEAILGGGLVASAFAVYLLARPDFLGEPARESLA